MLLPVSQQPPGGLRTAFGWCIAGSNSPLAINKQLQFNSLYFTLSADQNLADANNRFIPIETYEARIGVRAPVIGKEESRFIKILNDLTKFVDERYESGLLWKSGEPNLPDNSGSVLNRFKLVFSSTHLVCNSTLLAPLTNAVPRTSVTLLISSCLVSATILFPRCMSAPFHQ